MEAAEQADQARGELARELDLDALDAAAAAQNAAVSTEDELQPTAADVEGELPQDDFDRAVTAGGPSRRNPRRSPFFPGLVHIPMPLAYRGRGFPVDGVGTRFHTLSTGLWNCRRTSRSERPIHPQLRPGRLGH